MKNRYWLAAVICFLLALSVRAEDNTTLAFPGAEGFGAKTRGAYALYEKTGKNSDLPKILHVTKLDDKGSGSLREALDMNFPRIIVFDVGGIIMLNTPLEVFGKHNLTIAGQTAPGDGIILKGARLTFHRTHDVIIRGLKVRPADGNEGEATPDDRGGITFRGDKNNKNISTENMIIDHCSFAWTANTAVTMWHNTGNITIQNSILAEPLRNVPGHSKFDPTGDKGHNLAIMVGPGADHVSIIRNLFAHSAYRNPVFGGANSEENIEEVELMASTFGEIINNVVYNSRVNSSVAVQRNRNYEGDQPQLIVGIGNYHKNGVNKEGEFDYGIFPDGQAPDWDPKNYVNDSSRFYFSGNINMHRVNQSQDDWDIFQPGSPRPKVSSRVEDWPFPKSNVNFTKDSILNYEKLLGMDGNRPRIGAFPRDNTDKRIINDVKNGNGHWIDSVNEVGGYPEFIGGIAPTDTDRDGMPDDWEEERGLDKGNPNDAHSDSDNNGYHNIEEYINSFFNNSTGLPVND